MKTLFRTFALCVLLSGTAVHIVAAPPFISTENSKTTFTLFEPGAEIHLLLDTNDNPGVKRAVDNLKNDFLQVTGSTPTVIAAPPANEQPLIIIGTIGESRFIEQLISEKKIDKDALAGKFEKYIIQNVSNPFPGTDEALVIAGSDRRGTIYGIYELSKQIGVSPWYWWADVPAEQQQRIHFVRGTYTDNEPAVRYRGIFINDEAPALAGWAQDTFGGFNSRFYEKVFELILRLKGNLLWPAMWGSAFYDDDAENGSLANEMGIIIGTSHHEPLGRAHDEWRRYGSGEWDYTKNKKALTDFWTGGMERMKTFETVVTIGMRGDGDEAMSEETNIKLLESIVKAQRDIIGSVTRKKAQETPQVWALYKEVQDYYDKGMRVPDDVTLLLCDDNWGNVRKLPDVNAKARKGGYGMYYHFDYVGGPRNYKWINVSQIQRIWEQMNLTYEHGVDRLWIVNVGDLKPMEYPISFFLDMAWEPAQFNSRNLLEHTEKWCKQQFGEKYAKEAACLINLYTKYNRRVTPELLNDKTYSLEHYNEFERVVAEYKELLIEAMRLYHLIPQAYKGAFDQLVLFPINACCNLYEMYFAVAKNRHYAAQNDIRANSWADRVKECFERDSVLTYHYNHTIADGKWAHIMDQVRIGYTYWQQPSQSVMPEVMYVSPPALEKTFIEKDGYVSIEAAHYSRSSNPPRINWEIIPDMGKTISGVTTFPQKNYPADGENIYLEYDIEFETAGEAEVQVLVSPTLNFNANKGLRYAVSFDGGEEQLVNINGHYRGELGQWQAESIIKTSTKHTIQNKGKHTLRFRPLEPGIVLQKIMIDTGNLQPSYLGAPESEIK
jgi:hypothetical protein